MLKTLRITSLVAVVLAVCGVFLIVFLGLKEDPDIIAYLDSPGVVEQFKDKVTDSDKKEPKSPLVAQAGAFALRIDPPPPPPPPTPEKRVEPVRTVQREKPVEVKPPPPPVKVNAKFTLLATVMCQADPSRSMVLLRQAGGKDEWFWQGQRVGNLDIDEVHDGSAVFSQNGRNPQELFVPAKPETKTLLKAQAAPSRTGAAGASTMNVRLDPDTGEPAMITTSDSPVSGRSEGRPLPNRSIRVERGQDASAVRQEVSDRIRRIRTVPKPPSPDEQRASLENSIESIQEIMSNDSSAVSEEQQQREKETWMKMLQILQSEKARLGSDEDTASEQDDTSQAEQERESKTEPPTQNPDEE